MTKNVLEYLEDTAARYPDKKAAADGTESVTYRELLERAQTIGTVLAQREVKPRKPIPVFAEKSVKTLEAFLGIVYAGCFYLLIDPKQPASRIRQILDTLQADTMVIDPACRQEWEELEYAGTGIFWQEWEDKRADACCLQKIRRQALDIDPLYAIFTSGSTGIPKGVVVSHRSVIDFMDYFPELFGIDETDIVGNQAPFDFDVSVKDIYSCLKTGATLEIIPKRLFSFPTKLLDYLEEREITSLTWAVSALCIITTLHGFDYKVPSKIRRVLFSGEVMPVRHLNAWQDALPDTLFVNLYGPTEITCNCTYYKVSRKYQQEETLPIGIPFPNEQVFLLDESGQEITVDQPDKSGEICVAGTALSLGYYNNPEQTAGAFVQNPLNTAYPERIYRTGDLGKYGKDGLLYYVGRKDFQIKHMGHRIELGEIEMAMQGLRQVSRCCCLFDEGRGRIVAFYVGEAERKQLLNGLREVIPVFMIPNEFRKVEEMPLTKNGKIDRKQLMKRVKHG